MNRAKVLAELEASAVRDWYVANPALLDDKVGRAVAVAAGRRAMILDGEAGWNGDVHAGLLGHPSPAVAFVAAALWCHGSRWARGAVACALVEWFGLHGSWRAILDGMAR